MLAGPNGFVGGDENCLCMSPVGNRLDQWHVRRSLFDKMGIPFTDLARLSRTFGPNDSAIWGGVDSYSLLREPVEEQPSCL
jgi:hypothetical protein